VRDEHDGLALGREQHRQILADRVAVFSARPGTIKQVIAVDEPHPRRPRFMTSAKFHALRDQLYSLLHDEIRKTMAETHGGAR
jgi:NitT/TauT family transport system ATP-binding protein